GGVQVPAGGLARGLQETPNVFSVAARSWSSRRWENANACRVRQLRMGRNPLAVRHSMDSSDLTCADRQAMAALQKQEGWISRAAQHRQREAAKTISCRSRHHAPRIRTHP